MGVGDGTEEVADTALGATWFDVEVAEAKRKQVGDRVGVNHSREDKNVPPTPGTILDLDGGKGPTPLRVYSVNQKRPWRGQQSARRQFYCPTQAAHRGQKTNPPPLPRRGFFLILRVDVPHPTCSVFCGGEFSFFRFFRPDIGENRREGLLEGCGVLALRVPRFVAAGISVADGEVSHFSPLFRTSLGLVLDVLLGHEPSDFGAPNVVSAVFFVGEVEEVASGGGEHLQVSHRVKSSTTWQSELGSNTTGSNR